MVDFRWRACIVCTDRVDLRQTLPGYFVVGGHRAPRSGAIRMISLLLGLALFAQIQALPTAISIGAPTAVNLGDVVTLQARLVDSAGYSISKKQVDFVVPLSFLDGQDDVVVASSLTSQDGLAVAAWQVRSTGSLTLKARFKGDQAYAATEASTSVIA